MVKLFGLGLVLCTASGWVLGLAAPDDSAGQDAEPRVSITPRKLDTRSAELDGRLRIDVKLVEVPVTVTDALDRPITSLTKESFRVLEDGIEQKITSLTREEGPISLGLLFDTSGSMKGRMDASINALKLLFSTAGTGDEYFMIQFSDEVRLLGGGFTPEPDSIYGLLGNLQPKGWTALLDAIALGTNQMKSAKNRRKVLLILSDGNDNYSRFSESEVKSMVVESDVRVYAIGITYRPRLLKQLAEQTGGSALVARNMAELPDVVQHLSEEIRSHYVLGYRSTNNQNDGKYRKVKVELVQPQGTPSLRASWRHGYYAPE